MINDSWLDSEEVRKILKISTCELAHLRTAGKIRFVKKGNKYLYSATDCRSVKKSVPETEFGSSCQVDEC